MTKPPTAGERIAETGWFISDKYMNQVQRDMFHKMIGILKHGGSTDVVARIDGRVYGWQCDGLSHARYIDAAIAEARKPVKISWKDCNNHIEAICGNTPEFNWRKSSIKTVIYAVLESAIAQGASIEISTTTKGE